MQLRALGAHGQGDDRGWYHGVLRVRPHEAAYSDDETDRRKRMEKNNYSQRLSGHAAHLRDQVDCPLSVTWPSAEVCARLELPFDFTFTSARCCLRRYPWRPVHEHM